MNIDMSIPDKLTIRDKIKEWIKEDVPNFDIGGYVVGNDIGEAILYGKSNGIVAGIPFANIVFDRRFSSVARIRTS